ncbi:MAG: ABC transporter permease subunit [Deltaproteobacteria bacterium]|nr:ABC transporter permease subunit [Deltaproteobacteria bacterium]
MEELAVSPQRLSLGIFRPWWRHRYFWRILSMLIAFGGWEAAGRFGSNIAVPSFSQTAHALFSMTLDGTLPEAYMVTLQPLVLGLLLAAFLGIGFGIAMGLSRTLEWFTVVIFIALQAAPMAAVIPLITFVYGIGFTAKVVAVFVLATPGIILNSYQGVRNVNVSLIQMSRSFLATKRQQITKVILPAASNMIVASMRMGLAASFVGIILAELLITPTGLGDLITYNQSMGEYANMYATICSLIIISALSISFLQWVENNYSGSRRKKRKAAKVSGQSCIIETEDQGA